MRGEDTFEALQALSPQVNVLLCSSYRIEGRSELLARGRSDFIEKPFTVKKLSSKIRQLFEKQQKVLAGRR